MTPPASAPRHEPDQGSAVDSDTVDALAQLSFLVQGTLAKRAAAHDVSMIQTRLLGILRDRTPTMQELARLLELDKSSITGLVDRAEKRGLVQRMPSATDRRAICVSLTPAGRRLISEVSAAFQGDIASMTTCLSATDRRLLSMLATRIVTEYHASA
jgi:MarR family transcriptional regulator, lower aerobic nicotinate degradation pathway regulator